MDAARDLNSRIHREFAFDPKATDVATPVEKAFKQRRGVCQDFAHIFIACIRSLRLPARYVSGYLETVPPPGKQRLAGADASHAWASVWCGTEAGWMDFDPTNNCQPAGRHITVAHGRDFFDVSPLRGVVYGTGEHTLEVAVDVIPVPTPTCGHADGATMELHLKDSRRGVLEAACASSVDDGQVCKERAKRFS